MVGSRTLLRLAAIECRYASRARFTFVPFYLDAFASSAYFNRQDAPHICLEVVYAV
jgi:hypothetical protein